MAGTGKTYVFKENSVPVLFGAPQIPHGLVWDRAPPVTALSLGKGVKHFPNCGCIHA